MKTINSIIFYVLTSVLILMVFNSASIRLNIIGLVILGIEFMTIKNYDNEVIFELLGITWLQKKFKNNKLIMNMTKE